MHLPARFGQHKLLLSFAGTLLVFFAGIGVTTRTTDAEFKERRLSHAFGQRITATAAYAEFARHQAVADRGALIKHKTLTLPQALRGRDLLQVFQNTALQMKHLVKAVGAHQRGGFFAAYTAGAKHGDFGFVPGGSLQLTRFFHPGR